MQLKLLVTVRALYAAALYPEVLLTMKTMLLMRGGSSCQPGVFFLLL
jgi:hypothetical protein